MRSLACVCGGAVGAVARGKKERDGVTRGDVVIKWRVEGDGAAERACGMARGCIGGRARVTVDGMRQIIGRGSRHARL